MLLSEINVAYYQSLMQGIREAIARRAFQDFRDRARADWARGDIASR
jgi:queuine tRNA-ribosyltransferase